MISFQAIPDLNVLSLEEDPPDQTRRINLSEPLGDAGELDEVFGVQVLRDYNRDILVKVALSKNLLHVYFF